MASTQPTKFRISVPDQALDRLASRLADVDLPDAALVKGAEDSWTYGTNLTKLKDLLQLWKDGSPTGSNGKVSGKGPGQGVKSWWRSIEESLNAYPQYKVNLEGVGLHFVHAKSKHEDAIPLIFSHGWPGSFYEAYLMLPKLLEKDPETGVAFHVVVPSLPGYGWSNDAPLPEGWGVKDDARILGTLMTDVLGYKQWFAHGGDWGSLVTRHLANNPACKIYHTNFLPPTKPPVSAVPLMALQQLGFKRVFDAVTTRFLSAFELLGVRRGLDYLGTGSGYVAVQSTKPATLGYALYGNPAGIASWILEKFQIWTDPRSPSFVPQGEKPLTAFSDETMIVNFSIYYLTSTIHTSFMLYYTNTEDWRGDMSVFNPGSKKPYGHSAYKYELARPPKAWIPNHNVNLVWHKEKAVGGHFAAWEDPDGLAADLADFASKFW